MGHFRIIWWWWRRRPLGLIVVIAFHPRGSGSRVICLLDVQARFALPVSFSSGQINPEPDNVVAITIYFPGETQIVKAPEFCVFQRIQFRVGVLRYPAGHAFWGWQIWILRDTGNFAF